MYFALFISMSIGSANVGPMIGANMSHILGAASGPERRRATQSFPLQRTNERTKEGSQGAGANPIVSRQLQPVKQLVNSNLEKVKQLVN